MTLWLWLSITTLLLSCSYKEDVETCLLTVTLVYPENTVAPYQGVRVELRSIGRNMIFVDSTNTQGVVRYRVTPGIYEASTTSQFVDSAGTTWWRYNFNGVRSMIVVSPDSLNEASIELKASKKKIVH